MTTYTVETLDTPDGPFTLVENPEGAVVAAGWSADVEGVAGRARLAPADLTAGACRASAAVRAFYAGDVEAPARVPVAQHGTAFQRAVWTALREIPRGEVRRYGELAAELGSPGASRAVGAACGRNAVALFVPCHRVVGASGSLTGFAWGVEVKRELLTREGATV
ncbi:methylated-DNA--[protein]-cysteine S-methyltransferase [Demequina lutea]|uniref:methylated-DNA--[protein]-cysteine S-methyltransferase n=1 Tax=Demequina lutea TaxID=431489 RepID=A0A7Y9ZEN2_9MICO|nr:methylated-DNA--[protein]-cysteine S-methyltransferase [Demequina lutea]NYI42580.1 methylated-DNA-[protein]-cysteine S-methyltransferase [Demequina lutea]